MTFYELIRRLLCWEAEQTLPPPHMASAVQETMEQKQRRPNEKRKYNPNA